MILSEIEQSIKRKIESIGTPIRDWPVCIRYGIKTGLNDAFIIDASKREEILRNCTTESERVKANEIIRPILRGKDIKAYSYKFNNQYIIATYNGYISEKGMHFPSIDIEEYPAVKSHLDYYWNRISKRSDQGDTPYNLRSCSYWDDFNKPKIVWSDISSEPSFVKINEPIYFNNGCYMLLGAPEWFVDYLNSDLVKWYFPIMATDLGAKATRYFKQFVEMIPVPSIFSGDIQSTFGFTEAEMKFISASSNE